MFIMWGQQYYQTDRPQHTIEKSKIYEENIPAKEEKAGKNTRFSRTHEDGRGAQNGEAPPDERTKKARSLT